MKDIIWSPLESVIDAFRRGGMVIICDDADRENEGDLAIAAEHITHESYAFMMNYGRGLVCLSLSQEIGKKFKLPLQVLNNNSSFQTPFAPSLTLARYASHHASVSARVATTKWLLDPAAKAEDFISPGSVHPLLAHPAGVVGRGGQTEGSYDLARLAGLQPAALICEILSEDGQMMRGRELMDFARHHKLPITSVAEIFSHRLAHDTLLREERCGLQATRWGEWDVRVFYDDVSKKEHLALTFGEINHQQPVLLRIHSECLTGDVLGSARCDCGPQLHAAMKKMRAEGAGVLLYLRQEGRGIGLSNKLKAYELQDLGRDTVEANLELGFEADERDFRIAVQILKSMGIARVRLLTNNPRKMEALAANGIEIVARESLEVPVSSHAEAYMAAKKTKLGHLLRNTNL